MYASGYCSSWERSCSTAVQLVSGFFHRLRLCSRARFLRHLPRLISIVTALRMKATSP